MKKLLLAFALVCGFALPVSAAEDPFAGTWKLDLSKSQVTGTTFTYSKTSNGMMRYDDGANRFNFGIDGKEYPTLDGRTTTWVANSDHSWTSTGKFRGKVTATTTRTLSDDGKTLTFHTVGTSSDGNPVDETAVFTRVAGGPGLAGTWRTKAYDQKENSTFSLSFPSPEMIRWHDVEQQAGFEGKMDGSDLPYTGPRETGKITVAMKRESSRKLS